MIRAKGLLITVLLFAVIVSEMHPAFSEGPALIAVVLSRDIAPYRAALEERTRERVPLQWAGTQLNLALALREVGRRELSAQRLQSALEAAQQSSTVYLEGGNEQYQAYFDELIHSIETEIAALEDEDS